MPVAWEVRVSCSRDGWPRVIGTTLSCSCIGFSLLHSQHVFYGTPLPASAERNSLAQLVATAATPTSTDHSVRKHMQADSAGVTETCATAQTAHLITTIRVDLPGFKQRANVLTAPLPTPGELWPWPRYLEPPIWPARSTQIAQEEFASMG